jgi:serine/threonine protein kinase/Tfp pilus assembly protein PilF
MADSTPREECYSAFDGGLAQAWNLDPQPAPQRWGAGLKQTAASPGPDGPDRPGASIDFSFRIEEDLVEPRPGGATARGPSIRFPEPGDTLGSFKIISELGRGAFGRVYLAEQAELGNRLVALKVAVSLGDEPRNLARLQHAHIVPIHSVHDDPGTGLRLICMPYVGGANLAEVLKTAGARLATQATGRSLVEALDRVGHSMTEAVLSTLGSIRSRTSLMGVKAVSSPAREVGSRAAGSPSRARPAWASYLARFSWWRELEDTPTPAGADPDGTYEPARRYLRSATYVQASVWIAARLAEALEHAHDRGILHRDIKPSNVLIASDGTPMLLDFNLSAVIRPGADDDSRAALGGTLPYMAPEHLDAFNPLGHTPPEAVGPAADIYGLGLILFEMVAGRHPFSDPPACPQISDTLRLMVQERKQGAPSARAINPMVPWSLESILRRCLDPDPAMRYTQAGDLAEDLRRLLDDRPLKHAPELSTRERLKKWARRHPWTTSSSTIGGAALGAVAACGMIAWSLADHLESSRARDRFAAFSRRFQECQLLLNTLSGPVERLDQGIVKADEALRAYHVGEPGDWRRSPDVRRLDARQRQTLCEAVSELVQLRARAGVWVARRTGSAEALRQAVAEAVAWLNRAERFDPRPSFVFYQDRAQYLAELGLKGQAEADRLRAQSRPPTTSRDYTALGSDLLAGGQPDRAERALSQAVALDPTRFWSWFALGLCHSQQGRHHEAAADFAVCSVLAPGFSWPHVNRGLALAAAGRLPEARAAYDRAIRDDPNFIEARVNRALCCLEQGDAATALADLDRVLSLGHHDAPILAARAEALARLGRRDEALRGFESALRERPGDPVLLVARGTFRLETDRDGARADFTRALERDPRNARAHLGMAYLMRRKDPAAALEHLDAALAADPDFGDALQLRALIRGRLGDERVEADIDRLERTPTAGHLYNAACALALLYQKSRAERHAERALVLLARAMAAGFAPSRAAADPDLRSIADRPDFRLALEGEKRGRME